MRRGCPPAGIVLAIVLLVVPVVAQAASPRVREIIRTSEAGARLESAAGGAFVAGRAGGTVLEVWPDSLKQEIHGIGSSFTESAAFVLAHLEPEKRREVMRMIFGREGANFTLTRTHIGACDFSVEGKYSYLESPEAGFSIAPDSQGFDPRRYPGVQDAGYDLLPMIREAQAIKRAQGDAPPRIIASAWTSPPWMKDIEDWYIPGSAENDWQGTGGHLKPEYRCAYADYLVDYLDAYTSAGVNIWGLTPVNEPLGNGGNWESLDFTAESQNVFVRDFLGPRLRDAGHRGVELLIYDQNRDAMESFTDLLFADPRTAPFVSGVAVHWYASTFKVYEEAFERVRARFPTMDIVHTEGCIDNLGVPAPGGVGRSGGLRGIRLVRERRFLVEPVRDRLGLQRGLGFRGRGRPSALRAGAPLRAEHHRQPGSLGQRLGGLERGPGQRRRAQPRGQHVRRAHHDRHPERPDPLHTRLLGAGPVQPHHPAGGPRGAHQIDARGARGGR